MLECGGPADTDLASSANGAVRLLGPRHAGGKLATEAALGSYPGLRNKTRTNAVALLGWLAHPQAAETVVLLVGNENPDVASRAMRAAGRSGNQGAVPRIAALLARPETPPILAAESVRSLATIGSASALAALNS